jgi:hypothetical protein
MTFAGIDFAIAKTNIAPERAARDVEAAHFTQRETFFTGKVKAAGAIIQDFDDRLFREVDLGAWRMRRRPALHVRKAVLDAMPIAGLHCPENAHRREPSIPGYDRPASASFVGS